jgi:MFS family permease
MNRDLVSAKPDSARAWLMVAVVFLAGFVVFGIIYSFGVFFKPMADEFHASAAAASGFFSFTSVVQYSLGAFTGRLTDRFGPRCVVTVGAVAFGLGLGLTALASRLWFGYLAYGVGVGIGAACCYVPTLAVIGGWFVRRRNTALGIASAGGGCGMIVLPPLAAVLIHHYGWRATNLIFGFAATVVLFGCAVVVKSPPTAPSTSVTEYSLTHVFRSREFALLYLSWMLATTALFVPFVFLPVFARDHGVNEVAAAGLVSAIGGASVIGRVALGPLGDRLAVLPLFKLTVFIMGISYVIWLLSSSYESLLFFALVLGIGYGSRISLVPGVLIECFGLQNLGTVLGVFFSASGLSALLGPLLAGLAVDLTGSYSGAIVVALATGFLGFIAIVPLGNHGQLKHRSAVAAE